MYKIISSSSKGNSVIYDNSIMVDCGISFDSIKPFLKDLQIILLTHEHKDHVNYSTLKKIIFERPGIRIGYCNDWFLELQGRNIDRFKIGSIYDYGLFKISPFKLYHDIENCGYRIFINNYKIFHATDSNHLEEILAPNYDLYAIESNYDEETIFERILEKESIGEFAYQRYSINSHLSEQQANNFFYKNKKDTSILLRLHKHKNI